MAAARYYIVCGYRYSFVSSGVVTALLNIRDGSAWLSFKGQQVRRDNEALYLLRYNRGRLWQGCARGYNDQFCSWVILTRLQGQNMSILAERGGCLGLSSLGCQSSLVGQLSVTLAQPFSRRLIYNNISLVNSHKQIK